MFKYILPLYFLSINFVFATTIPYQPRPKSQTAVKPILSWVYAYSEKEDDTLGNAKKIPWSKFKDLFNRGDITLTNDRINWESTARNLDFHKKNVTFVLDELSQYPDILSWIIKKPTLAEKQGINYIYTYEDKNGEEQRVMTYGEEYLYALLADALENRYEKNNTLNIYNMLYAKFPKNYLKESNLTSPSELLKSNHKEILSEIKNLIKKFNQVEHLIPVATTPPEGFPATCEEEIGAGTLNDYYYNGDQSNNTCEFHEQGIYKNVDYPLKYYTTCVKKQASRGTCVTFATISAIESAFAVKENKWYNFSEEHLNNSYHMKWMGSNFGDGAYVDTMFQSLVDQNYKLLLEKDWIYNPSFFRIPMPNRTYVNSCPEQYTGLHCSETNHQGLEVCSYDEEKDLNYCGYQEWAMETEKTVTSTATISSFKDPDWAVQVADAALKMKIPLVGSIPITNSFNAISDSGYVEFKEELESAVGGWHAVPILGVVSNEQLPEGAPAGAGGGYFVIKNSYATCWGDGGYAYLPIDWMKRYNSLYSMIDVVQ